MGLRLDSFGSMSAERMSAEDHARWWRKRGQAELRQILYWCWDPIGVNDAFRLTETEYDGYAGQVFGLVKSGAGPQAVADYLGGVERESITLSTTDEQRLAVGRRVVEWYGNSLDY